MPSKLIPHACRTYTRFSASLTLILAISGVVNDSPKTYPTTTALKGDMPLNRLGVNLFFRVVMLFDCVQVNSESSRGICALTGCLPSSLLNLNPKVSDWVLSAHLPQLVSNPPSDVLFAQ